MGNCQAAEAATVVIQHPQSQNNKIERIYWSVSAHQVMNSNPGHYVAHVINSNNGTPFKHLKLLRPHDTLLIGQIYRLISFEDVLKEFAAKKCVKLEKLLRQKGGLELQVNRGHSTNPNPTTLQVEREIHQIRSNGGSSSNINKGGGRQWRPALQSIAEIGT